MIAVEPNRYRLELAERMGADVLVQSGEGSAEAEVRRAAGGEVDCALEMSGAPVAVVAATRWSAPAGGSPCSGSATPPRPSTSPRTW